MQLGYNGLLGTTHDTVPLLLKALVRLGISAALLYFVLRSIDLTVALGARARA